MTATPQMMPRLSLTVPSSVSVTSTALSCCSSATLLVEMPRVSTVLMVPVSLLAVYLKVIVLLSLAPGQSGNKNSHSEVEPGQPVERGEICDEEAWFVRRDVLDQLAGGLVPHLQVVDLAPAHLAGAEDQQTVACLVVERTLETVTGPGLTGLNHLVATRSQHLALLITGPAVEQAVVLGGEGAVPQQAHGQVILVLRLGYLVEDNSYNKVEEEGEVTWSRW